jgi:hypothetical protein
MSNGESLIRARYAVTLLKVARSAKREEAIRLIEGLAKDWLGMESDAKIAGARQDALKTFGELVTALRADEKTLNATWERATQAALNWRAALE